MQDSLSNLNASVSLAVHSSTYPFQYNNIKIQLSFLFDVKCNVFLTLIIHILVNIDENIIIVQSINLVEFGVLSDQIQYTGNSGQRYV